MFAQPHRSIFFIVIAVLCFAIALLLSLEVLSGSHQDSWVIGGLLAFAAAHLP